MNARVRRPARPQGAVSVRAVMSRFALTSFVALVVVALVTALVSRRVGTDQAIDDASRVAWVSAHGVVEPLLTPELLAQDLASLQRLDDAVREYVLRGELVRVKIWTPDGRIVYSDEPRLIGEQFELSADKRDTLRTGDAHAEVSDLDGPENRYELEEKLLEVYQLIESVEGEPLVFESYFRYSGVSSLGRQFWGQFAPVAIGALVALQLVQLPFAYGMARRLRSGEDERVRLMRRSMAASEAERRRIASDLHDGVVQDLTGVSLGLAALARRGAVASDELDQASAAIRSSVKSLRSLLVEIYPPNLREEGLESAVGDLLSAIGQRGIETKLRDEVDDHDLSADAQALAYRVVQEALRNVVSHSGASAVLVKLQLVDDQLQVLVDDNGRGFSTDLLAERGERGHVGLRALGGLLADAGAELEVRSAATMGTRVEARIPRSVDLALAGVPS
ncbi:MAG: sensor histidine kinase [Acidimicrobiales bacterium]|nr:sensor histidine kinase [Acidimicrobiales bacterium]MCB9392166.1 sensor histidine kinase [Acidimicrobiaceae bacterium]